MCLGPGTSLTTLFFTFPVWGFLLLPGFDSPPFMIKGYVEFMCSCPVFSPRILSRKIHRMSGSWYCVVHHYEETKQVCEKEVFILMLMSVGS